MSQIRIGHSLNEGEKKHIDNRRPIIQECLKRNNFEYKQVPNIALLGSGGGERAMVGLLGSLHQMVKEDLLDCVLYLSGVSGSTWCMSSLYEECDWSNDFEKVLKKIVHRLGHDSVDFSTQKTKLLKYYKENDNFSLTDVWSCFLVPTIVKEIDEHTLSSHREGHSKDPYPIYTVIDKDSKSAGMNKDSWFELTPHEAGYSLTGAFVETSKFGSQFDKGVLTKSQPEKDMLFIQGLCGSAIADMEEIWKWLKELIAELWKTKSLQVDDRQGSRVLLKLVELHLCFIRGEDCSLQVTELNELLKGKTKWVSFEEDKWSKPEPLVKDKTNTQQLELNNKTMLVCQNFHDWFGFPEILKMIVEVMKLTVQWTWGTHYNFLQNVTAPDVDPKILRSDIRHFEDAGLLNNSPFISVLRPERNIDLIISLDFSSGDPMTAIK